MQRLLTYDDLVALGYINNRVTLNRRIRRGEFPAPILVGSRNRAWLQTEVDAWEAVRTMSRPYARHVPHYVPDHMGGHIFRRELGVLSGQFTTVATANVALPPESHAPYEPQKSRAESCEGLPKTSAAKGRRPAHVRRVGDFAPVVRLLRPGIKEHPAPKQKLPLREARFKLQTEYMQ